MTPWLFRILLGTKFLVCHKCPHPHEHHTPHFLSSFLPKAKSWIRIWWISVCAHPESTMLCYLPPCILPSTQYITSRVWRTTGLQRPGAIGQLFYGQPGQKFHQTSKAATEFQIFLALGRSAVVFLRHRGEKRKIKRATKSMGRGWLGRVVSTERWSMPRFLFCWYLLGDPFPKWKRCRLSLLSWPYFVQWNAPVPLVQARSLASQGPASATKSWNQGAFEWIFSSSTVSLRKHLECPLGVRPSLSSTARLPWSAEIGSEVPTCPWATHWSHNLKDLSVYQNIILAYHGARLWCPRRYGWCNKSPELGSIHGLSFWDFGILMLLYRQDKESQMLLLLQVD